MKYSFIVSGMLLLLFIPENLIFQSKIPVCVFKYYTGIECPFCGMTRAGYNIVHVQLLSAFRYNAVSLMLPLMLITEVVYDLFPSARSEHYRRVALILFIAGLAALFLVRVLQYFLAG